MANGMVRTERGGDYVGTNTQEKDSQRTRLYAAEQHVRLVFPMHIGIDEPTAKRGEMCQRFVDDVLKRKYIQRKYPSGQITVWVKEGAWRYAHAKGSNIDLPSGGPWAFDKLVLLHEIAHVFERRLNGRQMGGHGWTFAAIFLDLVRNVCGKEVADSLKGEYRYRKVKFRAPRTRTLTDDQKDAAAARLEKARAVRDVKLKPQRELRDELMALYKRVNTGRFYTKGRWKGKAIITHSLDGMKILKAPDKMNHAERVELKRTYERYLRDKHSPIVSGQITYREPTIKEQMWQQYALTALRPPSILVTGLTS